MQCILHFLNENQGALMVIITFVYAVATFFICRANIKASDAAKAQLEEMKKQFDEDNRPIIEAELVFLNRVWCVLRLVNHGKRTAQHVRVELSQEFINGLPNERIKSLIEKEKGKECIIGVDQHYDLFIGDSSLKTSHDIKPICGNLSYEANGRGYSSEIFIDLERYMTFFSADTDEEKLREAINMNTKALQEIRNDLKSISEQQQSLYSVMLSGGEEDTNV